jgi:hypothetical protein
LADVNTTWIFSIEFYKNSPISDFKKILPEGAELVHADGRTDGYDETNSLLSQFWERSQKYNVYYAEVSFGQKAATRAIRLPAIF